SCARARSGSVRPAEPSGRRARPSSVSVPPATVRGVAVPEGTPVQAGAAGRVPQRGVPAHLVLAGSARRLAHDTVVVRQGEASATLFLVERGAMRLSSVTVDGRELVVAVLGTG